MGIRTKKATLAEKAAILMTAAQMQNGPLVDPISRIFLYSSDEWERFIDEWVSEYLKARGTLARGATRIARSVN